MRKTKRTDDKAEVAEIITDATDAIDPADAVAVAAARVDLYARSLAFLPKSGKAAQISRAAHELAGRNAARRLADLRGENVA